MKDQIVETVCKSRGVYGSETWAVGRVEAKKLDAAGRKIWRARLGICWKDKVTNERLAEMIGDRPIFSHDTVIRRKLSYIHIFKNGVLLFEVPLTHNITLYVEKELQF